MSEDKSKKYSLLFFSGNRAEYHIQEPLILALAKDSSYEINFMLYHKYTNVDTSMMDNKNINIIRLEDEFETYANEYKSKYMHSFVIANVINQVSNWMLNNSNEIDLALAYADRFETFAFAIATSQSGIPLMHLEAGDITEGGTPDDNVRHSISKLAHLFMSSTKEGMSLLKRFGEEDWRIHFSGLLGYCSLKEGVTSKNNIDYLYQKYKISKTNQCIIIATMHPLPFNSYCSNKDALAVFESLIEISKIYEHTKIIITYPNADRGSNKIVNMINKIKCENITIIKSLGKDYHQILSLSKIKKIILLGNSSSIIKEAPFYNCHHINIGQRQHKRVSAETQINIEADKSKIIKEVINIINSDNIQPILKNNPYYKDNSINEMINYIKTMTRRSKQELLLKKLS